MRVLRKVFSVVAPMAVVALMGLPAVASADGTSNRAWIDSGEFLGDSGGDYDRRVVLDVSGNLDLWHSGGMQLDCEVTGEIEVWNDWQGGEPTWAYQDPESTLDTPAQNEVTSLQIAGSPATACDVSGVSCSLSSVSFSGLPWAGATSAGQTHDTESTFSGVSENWSWNQPCGGGSGVSGTIRITPQDPGCIGGFDVVQSQIGTSGFVISGALEIDDFEGLDGGDCLLVW